MLILKPYQETCLEELSRYLTACDRQGPKMAFYEQTGRQYFDVPVLKNLPYVCLRVPTGGGKTLMPAGLMARKDNKPHGAIFTTTAGKSRLSGMDKSSPKIPL